MVCRLCLENNSEVLEMFNNKGLELKIAMMIGKHFWFEPKAEDPVSSNICHSCWKKLLEFHEFYKCVEKAQQLLTVEVIVKTENNLTFFDTTVEDVELPTKNEQDNIDELYEEPFNAPCDMLAADDCGAIEFEFPADVKYQENNEKKLDDPDTLEINDPKEDKSDLLIKILKKKRITTKRSSKSDKVDSISEDATKTCRGRGRSRKVKVASLIKQSNCDQEDNDTKDLIHNEESGSNETTTTTTPYKGRGRPRKGEVVPLKTKSNCNQDNATKKRIRKDKNVSNVMTQEMSEIINRKISEYMKLKCDICCLELETFAQLRNHMTTVHEVRPYVKCCEKNFTRRSTLYDHIQFHLNPNIFKCEKCDKQFSDKRAFTYHNIVNHQSEDKQIFQCPQCPKKFARKYLLQNHKTKHNDVLKYFCPECNKGFSYMSALSSHIALRHGDYGTMCDICSKILKGPAAFKRHQLEHQGVVEPKAQCDLCGSWHKDKLSLAKHKRRHTYREEPQVCNICQKTYACREALYRHKRYVHESDGKYECNICQKSFKMANSLKEHMSQHTGLSLYRCPHCSRTFNNSSNMHKHRKHMHPKEFEEFRRLRKISARSKEPLIPTISSLSDATKEDSSEFAPFSSNVLELIKEKQENVEYELDTLR